MMRGQARLAVLLGLLLLVSGTYVYQNPDLLSFGESNTPASVEDKSRSLSLDEETKASLRHYFEGTSIDPKENSLEQAIRLDHSVGRLQISQGKYREAYRTYQKVLAISYRQGNLMGIGIALNIMAGVAYRAHQLDEALLATPPGLQGCPGHEV